MSAATAVILVHEIAKLAALLSDADNAERQALVAIGQAVVPLRLGQATVEEVSIKAAAIANSAFMREPDLSRPECWMLGLVSTLLGACQVVELQPGCSAASGADAGHFVVTQILRTFSALIRTVPTSLPLGVTPALYRVVANDLGRRFDGIGEVAMRKTFGTGGTLQ